MNAACFEQPISLLLLIVAFPFLDHRRQHNVSSGSQPHSMSPHELSSQALGGLRNEVEALERAPIASKHLDEPSCRVLRKLGAANGDPV